MPLIARFVGIDKFADPVINELDGAVRDARALWALFSDSIPGIDAALLADNAATAQAIRSAIDQSLRSAQVGDAVFFFFAGHGTPDHRLVAHDASAGDVAGTTIAMDELADAFSESKADAIICVLDCCFSGAAPARVAEALPRAPGHAIDVNSFTGPGRVLVTASRWDEEAAEHPTLRHGLLTEALMRVLTTGDDPIDLLTALGRMCDVVRSEAAALGHVQTPVVYGVVQGGFKVSRLTRGPKYEAAFPELKWIRVSDRIEDLAPYGFPTDVLSEWSHRYSAGLLPLQMAAINDTGVLAGRSAIVVAPTSAGKTFVGEMSAVRVISAGRKAVFLVPYRAVANEKFEDFDALYGTRLGMRVIRCMGDAVDQVDAFMKGRFDLAILTFEMFLPLAITNPAVLQRLGLVVVDEAQFITDPNRGITVELILTHIRTARERGVVPQLLALSATIGSLNHFDEWLAITPLLWTQRPVPLQFGVLDRSGAFQHRNPDGTTGDAQFMPGVSICQRRDEASSQDVIVPLVRMLVHDSKSEKVIIFRDTRGQAEGCAAYLGKDLGLLEASNVAEGLSTLDPSETSKTLTQALQGGVAFHNTNLNRPQRIAVERAFRDPTGPLRVLTATATMAAGVNTPASTVIIAEVERREGPYSVSEVKNMAGRAGRLGLQEAGRAIILAETPIERRQLFAKYVQGTAEAVRSSFEAENLGTWVMRLLAQVKHVPRTDVGRLLANTFGGYLAAGADPGWAPRTAREIDALVARMEGNGLVQQSAQDIGLTPLGRVCGLSPLHLESTLKLIEMLRFQRQPMSAEALMVLIQAVPEMDAGYTPLAKGQKEMRWSGELASEIGHDVANALQRGATDVRQYCARAKRACILLAWVRGVPIDQIETRFTLQFRSPIRHGDITGVANTTRFYLRAAFEIAVLATPTIAPSPDSIDVLLRQLEGGLPADAVGLLGIRAPMSRGEYLALLSAGVRDAKMLSALDHMRRLHILGSRRAAEIERALGLPSD
jgi:helicase